jgi:aminopeptidase N
MKKLLILALGIFAISCSSSNNKIAVETGVSWELASYRKAHISEINYDLEFRIPEDSNQEIQALELLTFQLDVVEQPLQLDFRESEDKVKSIVVNGKTQAIKLINEHLEIDEALLKQGENTIEINFFAGETSLNRKEEFLYTLFVPDRARTAFPCFDQPNLKATYDLTLNVPNTWTAVANAPVKRLDATDGRKNIQYHTSDLISTYLFSFVAGKFETISRNIEGREMTMIHRETDAAKVERNIDFIFYLHNASIKWLENYTGIKYPFKKFDFALIPSFQYGGMEHVGAIQYSANSLFLDENPSQSRLLSRASLIAHETAHMWFGDLVTMDWFNDVWTKEVFANFMAAKMVNPSFPSIDHDLNFLVRHYPSAYGIDRSTGANPIRQELRNLNEAGQMYGGIIYNKAPIMMRQLEMLVGEEQFREGMQEYLKTYAFKNATWPNLVNILNRKTKTDLIEWSDVWVNTSGRPTFSVENEELVQADPSGMNRVWYQTFNVNDASDSTKLIAKATTESASIAMKEMSPAYLASNGLFNSNGRGYGLFPASKEIISKHWSNMTGLQKGSALINLYEQFLEGNAIEASEYVQLFKWLVVKEKNQLLLNRMLGQLRTVYWSYLTPEERDRTAPGLERTLFHCMNDIAEDPGQKKMFFNAFRSVTLTGVNTDRLYSIWKGDIKVKGLSLSENDLIGLAGQLAIRLPEQSEEIVGQQLANIKNPDRKKRFEFIKPSLSNSSGVRDAFFESLKLEENRQTESWVLGALGNLHHPLRRKESIKYILPSLELLQEIQVTGDIFFPSRWLGSTLGNHNSPEAVKVVRDFLEANPDYNAQLRMKILQSADGTFRASKALNPKIVVQ